uniref:terminase n=1 Tax=uncultured Sphingomonas sp. TaxID=158754 RepID=UPI0035CC63BC
MSDSWVRDRMQAGEFPRPGTTANEYVEAYLEYRMRKTPDGDGDGLNLEAERARLAHAQADAKEMDNAERRKELASLPDMTSAFSSVIELVLGRVHRVGAIVAKGDVALRGRIDAAISDALEELSMTRVVELAGEGFDDEEQSDDPDDDD